MNSPNQLIFIFDSFFKNNNLTYNNKYIHIPYINTSLKNILISKDISDDIISDNTLIYTIIKNYFPIGNLKDRNNIQKYINTCIDNINDNVQDSDLVCFIDYYIYYIKSATLIEYLFNQNFSNIDELNIFFIDYFNDNISDKCIANTSISDYINETITILYTKYNFSLNILLNNKIIDKNINKENYFENEEDLFYYFFLPLLQNIDLNDIDSSSDECEVKKSNWIDFLSCKWDMF